MATAERHDPGLATFAFLWAFAILAHQVGYAAVGQSFLDLALTVSALVVLLFPVGSMLALLAALHVTTVAWHLPQVYNHWYFAGLVSLALLFGLGGAWGTSRRRQAPLDLSPAAAAARWCLLLVYLLSALHKLNADFVNPVVSCAPELYHQMAARLGGLPDAPVIDGAAIGATLAMELGVPLLLLLPRFRRVGIGVGIGFHLAMAIAGYWRFSAAGLALLTLFFPGGGPVFRTPMRLATLVLLLPAVALVNRGGDALFFWCTLLLGTGLLIHLARAGSGRPAPSLELRPGFAGSLGVALLLSSGLTPYLGLSTDRAFAMYSNLRTEGGRSNHFVIPAGIQPFGYQRDLVQVLGSNRPRLQRLAEAGMVVPFAEFQAILTEETRASEVPASVRYLRGGIARDVPSASSDADLDLPVAWLRLKLLRFRAVERAGPRRCTV